MFADTFTKFLNELKNFANKPAKLVNLTFSAFKNQLLSKSKFSGFY